MCTQACVSVQAAEDGRANHFLVVPLGNVTVVAHELLAQAEVNNEDLVEGSLHHQVGGLHVPVQVPLLVQVLQNQQGLHHQL
jgi:hypothetical protein